MKQSEAVKYLRYLFWAVQKIRSDITEVWGDEPIAMKLAEDLHPWLFGKQNIIPAFEKALARVDTEGELAPLDFYNIVLIATRQAPEILMKANGLGGRIPFTEPDRKWLDGWEPEEDNSFKVFMVDLE